MEQTKLFNGKEYGLLGVHPCKPDELNLVSYGRTIIEPTPDKQFAVYFRSYYAEIIRISEDYKAKLTADNKGIVIQYPILGQGSLITSEIECFLNGKEATITEIPAEQKVIVDIKR